MTPEDTQEIILLTLFRLKVLMLKENSSDRYRDLEHIFLGLQKALPPDIFPYRWQPRKIELPSFKN